MKKLFFFFFLFYPFVSLFAQYDEELVSAKTATIDGDAINILKMNTQGQRIKVKCFTTRDESGKLVSERYNEWAINKYIISYSSAGYSSFCDNPRNTMPVGVCFDDGRLVNQNIKEKMDGLVIAYPSGKIGVSNLREGGFNANNSSNGSNSFLNLRNAFDFKSFKSWANQENVSVFQTHLLYYKDNMLVYTNGSDIKRERRLLVACKDEDDNLIYCIVNLSGNNSLYEASSKISNYLINHEYLPHVLFIINLHTGCEDIFQAFNSNGVHLRGDGWFGNTPINNASNLIVFYYE